MAEYPTEEEEFDLMYADELEALEEIDNENPESSKIISTQKNVQLNNSSQTNPSPRPGTSKSFFQNSPALSQISYNTQNHVNRRLFGTPHPQQQEQRHASTPIGNNDGHEVTSGILQPTTSNDPLTELQQIGIQNRKRRLEDLFGDIRDIENEENYGHFNGVYESVEKKQKTEEEIDLELIQKILEARKQRRAQLHPLEKNNLEKLEALHAFKLRNLSHRLPQWPFITLIQNSTERLYVRMHSTEFEDKQIDEVNLYKSVNQYFEEGKRKLWEKAEEIILKRSTNKSAPAIETSNDLEILYDSTLWVEKYKPKKYLDLLSDESTNRSLLSWLKLWDKVVFNKIFIPKNIQSAPPNSFNKKTGKFEPFGRFRRRGKPTLNTDVDALGRPAQKIALLCGAPGLGKTTLAHTIARHAGYHVLELNASDDRSPEAFKLALENGTQMKSVLDKEKRPNCIILDEIDGSPLATIEYLVKFVTDSVVKKTGKKGGQSKNMILKRPVICICNDMYTPALRQLRQIAFVVNFPPIESARLSERLYSIAQKENVLTDMTALLALAEKSGNDIRSCLSMMQFFGNMKKPLTLFDVLKSNIGQKDRQKGLFSVWSSIFQIQRPQKTLTENEDDGSQLVTMTDATQKYRMDNILEVVNMGGDYERLMNGVFENYLLQKMPDSNLMGVAQATEWFCFSDHIQKCINKDQNYSIYPYLQFGFVIWHFLFAGYAFPKINFPNKGFEYSQKTNLQQLTTNSLKKGLCSSIRCIGEGESVILDSISLIKKVLCPSLRSVSLQLLTPKERSDLRHAVEVMADLGLVYIQKKCEDGTYQYQMEPDIDALCHFNDIQSHPLSYWSRQIIAREVDLERMRRAAPKTSEEVSKTKKLPQKTALTKNHLKQSLTSKPISDNSKVKQMLTKDFFGRITTKETVITVQEGGTDVIVKSPIWYRFKEGFNNAVRKDVTIMDLL